MSSRKPRGFTLIELMVTLAILAILMMLGLPSYSQWLLNTRIRNSAESIQNGLRFARSEAVRQSADVQFEMTSATNADWTVCTLPAGSADCAAAVASSSNNLLQQFASAGGATGVTIGATTAVGAPSTYGSAISGGVPASVTFSALGRPKNYGTTDAVRIDASSSTAGARRLVTSVSAGGQVRMCDPALQLSVSPQGCF